MLDVQGVATEFRTRRGTVHAVNGVSFAVGDGEIVGIVGETGCGKSVTIRSILGLVKPPGQVVEGSAIFDGQNLLALPRRQLRRIRGAEIGFVAQHPFGALNPILRIERQFRNVIKAHRDASDDECREMALAMLKAVEIPGPERVLDGYAHELSGGMAQRVVIGIAMVLNPKLVIADEPTTALDVTVQSQILDLITELTSRGRRSMILVTHDLGVVAQYCQKVVIMYAGKVVETGPVAEVFRRPAHPYTEALLAAVPRPGEPLRVLRGTLPDLVDYPKGCPYNDRCTYVSEPWDRSAPDLRPISESRMVSCHLDILSEEVLRLAPHGPERG
jgi:oligopeptide/dipeptide ABC transporter ATP-binding protein